MTIYGVDIHPQYQAGISIEQIRAEGFDFMAVKVSEGTATYGGQDWLRRGKACGLLCLAYHFLRPGNEVNQARVFATQLKLAGVPGMLDVEAVDTNNKATLNIGNVRAFLAECAAQGVSVPLMYLPKWYWDRIGQPDLRGLPVLWASSYPSTTDGYASALYDKVTALRWVGYGNNIPLVLQFTDQARVAGKLVDANAFRGTRDDFAELIGVGDMTPDQVAMLIECRDRILHCEQELYRLFPTRANNPADKDKPTGQIYHDTILGYSTNADAYGWRAENEHFPDIVAKLARLEALVTQLIAAPPPKPS